MTSTTFAPMPLIDKAMKSETCTGWVHRWYLGEANVVVCSPTEANAAAQKTNASVGVSFKASLMSFNGGNILVAKYIKLG